MLLSLRIHLYRPLIKGDWKGNDDAHKWIWGGTSAVCHGKSTANTIAKDSHYPYL